MKTQKSLIVALLSGCFYSNLTQAQPHVVLLWGQENCMGNGTPSEAPIILMSPFPSVLFASSVEGVITPLGPLQPRRNLNGALRYGSELSLGRELRRLRPGVQWMIIKYSVRRTSLHKDWNPKTGTTFTGALTHAEEILALGGHVTALCWVQGEEDSHREKYATAYYDNIVGLHMAVFDSFNVDLFLPVLVHPLHPAYEFVDMRIARTLEAYPDAIPIDDLPLIDAVQLTGGSQIELGVRLAQAIVTEMYPNAVDWDGNGAVEVTDVEKFLSQSCAGDADWNSDGITDTSDALEFFSAYFEHFSLIP